MMVVPKLLRLSMHVASCDFWLYYSAKPNVSLFFVSGVVIDTVGKREGPQQGNMQNVEKCANTGLVM